MKRSIKEIEHGVRCNSHRGRAWQQYIGVVGITGMRVAGKQEAAIKTLSEEFGCQVVRKAYSMKAGGQGMSDFHSKSRQREGDRGRRIGPTGHT